ncbi:MAG: hypothetical protein ACXAC7_10610 [Candidatus Hodarchaeales archaeon]|jgi:hypothetical protein
MDNFSEYETNLNSRYEAKLDIPITKEDIFSSSSNYNMLEDSTVQNTSFYLQLGGKEIDRGKAIALDSYQNILITGTTEEISEDLSFSNRDNNIPTPKNGTNNIFVSKLNSTGSLLWSIVFADGGGTHSHDIAVDSHDNIFISGYTMGFFPVTNPINENVRKGVFVSKLSPEGKILWSTVLGGTNDRFTEYIISTSGGLEVDSEDNIIVVGGTNAPDFPVLNPYMESFNGYTDFFLTKFSNNGQILWSTYFGGDDVERGADITIDSDDNIIITGLSSSSRLPNTKSQYLEINKLEALTRKMILSKFNKNGLLLWSNVYLQSKLFWPSQILSDSENKIIFRNHNATFVCSSDGEFLWLKDIDGTEKFIFSIDQLDQLWLIRILQDDVFLDKITSNDTDSIKIFQEFNILHILGFIIDSQGNAIITGTNNAHDIIVIKIPINFNSSLANVEGINGSLGISNVAFITNYYLFIIIVLVSVIKRFIKRNIY